MEINAKTFKMLRLPSAGLSFNGQTFLWHIVLQYRTHIQPEHGTC